MKDILVLFSYRSHKHGNIEALFKKLKDASLGRDLNLVRGSLSDSHISVKNGRLSIVESLSGRDVASFDTVYFELWLKAQQQALAYATYATRHGVPFFSEELASLPAMTKVGELAVLSDNGLPLPNTFTSSMRELRHVFKSAPPLQYPLVVKSDSALGGRNNYLVNNYAELEDILDNSEPLCFLAQEFIPNECDYRCVVLGGEVRLVLRRSRDAASGSHLNNTSKGAIGEVVPNSTLSKTALADAVKAAKLLNRTSFAGVDIIVDSTTGQHCILEVNKTPQIEIGAATDQKMAVLLDYIEQRARAKSS